MNRLQSTIRNLVKNYGSLRATARALEIDPAYLSRLLSGEKNNPSDAVLAKFGLKRTNTYTADKSNPFGFFGEDWMK